MSVYDLHKSNLVEKLDMISQLEKLTNFTKKELILLQHLSEDEEEEVRLRTAEILALSNSFEGKKILIKLLEDDNELVRVNACDSLSISNSEKVIEFLKERISKDKSSMVRGYAVMSIADIAIRVNYDLEKLFSFLNKLFKKEKVKRVKISFYYAFYIFGYKEYLSKLINELYCRSYHNRCKVIHVLNDILSKDNMSIIKLALEERLDKEKTIAVRSTINDLLQKIDSLELNN